MFGHLTYIAITALILNLAAAAVLTPVFRKIGLQDGYDETRRADYVADPVPVPVPTAPAGTGTPGRSADPVTNNRVVFIPAPDHRPTYRYRPRPVRRRNTAVRERQARTDSRGQGLGGLRERSVQVSGQQPQRVLCLTRTFA